MRSESTEPLHLKEVKMFRLKKRIPGRVVKSGRVQILFSYGALSKIGISPIGEDSRAWNCHGPAHHPDSETYYYLASEPGYARTPEEWVWIEMKFDNPNHPEKGGQLISWWPGKPEDQTRGIEDYIV